MKIAIRVDPKIHVWLNWRPPGTWSAWAFERIHDIWLEEYLTDDDNDRWY